MKANNLFILSTALCVSRSAFSQSVIYKVTKVDVRKYVKHLILIVAAMVVIVSGNAQKLSADFVDVPVSKNAKKKGMYVSTTMTKDGQIQSFISYDLKKKGVGFDVVTFDKSGKLLDTKEEIGDKTAASKYGIEIPEPGTIQNPADGKEVIWLRKDLMQKLTADKGHFEAQYASSKEYGEYVTTYTPVFKGYKFISGEKVKHDLNVRPMIFNMEEAADLQNMYTLLVDFKAMYGGSSTYIPIDGQVGFAGIIQEKISIKNPSPYNFNRIMTGVFDGKTFSFKNENIFELHYAAMQVCNADLGNGIKGALLAPLNSPTSQKDANKYLAKGKNYVTLLSIDSQGNLVDNVTFTSKSVRGVFGAYPNDGSTYVFGFLNADHDKFYRPDIGKFTHFQITQLKDNKEVFTKAYSVEDLENKLKVPAGEKSKFKFNTKILNIIRMETLPNGDLLLLVQTPEEYALIQFSPNGDLGAFYRVEKPDKELSGYDILIETIGKEVLVLFRFQNPGIAMGIKSSVSRGAGYMKNITFSRVDELMTYGRFVKLNPETKSMSEPVDILKDVMLGSDPLIQGEDGKFLIFARDAKRNYKTIIVQ
ncbi:MAG: hypothetical protein K9H64_04390 [Bacteroidales bacterium]|nr:hypothetical protein [Bacteroidales bacterium]MCF8454993.1 hypothetical protein [Bacteroidales bacterium]